MSEDSLGRLPDGRQRLPEPFVVSSAAASAAAQMLQGGNVSAAVELAGAALSTYAGVEQVTIMMIQLQPDDVERWRPLGDRAWIWVWQREGTSCLFDLPPVGGVERKLSLPWMSPLARREVVTVPDTELLPSEAEQDVIELEACNIRAFACRSITRNGQLLGSVAVARPAPGAWPDSCAADIELLSGALASTMIEERARLAAVAALQRADQAGDTQQQFFAALGHELRTPIAAILGSADMLQVEAEGEAGALVESVRRDTEVIVKAGEQLLAIVEELLGTGRALGEAPSRRPIDAADAVDDVLHWVRATAAAADVTLAADVPPGLRAVTTPVALRQILTNLIGNGIIHGGPGCAVHVTASQVIDEFRRPRIHIRVTDDGPGLTPEQQRDVFKPFVRFARPGVAGTGLGLSLSRSLAERDGGFIGVESTPGEGSTFWIDLPAVEEA